MIASRAHKGIRCHHQRPPPTYPHNFISLKRDANSSSTLEALTCLPFPISQHPVPVVVDENQHGSNISASKMMDFFSLHPKASISVLLKLYKNTPPAPHPEISRLLPAARPLSGIWLIASVCKERPAPTSGAVDVSAPSGSEHRSKPGKSPGVLLGDLLVATFCGRLGRHVDTQPSGPPKKLSLREDHPPTQRRSVLRRYGLALNHFGDLSRGTSANLNPAEELKQPGSFPVISGVMYPMIVSIEMRPCVSSVRRRRSKLSTPPSAMSPGGSKELTGSCTTNSDSKARSGEAV